jgi:DNA-directed RNA polymerase subunit A"
MNEKRILEKEEIDNLLDFIKPNENPACAELEMTMTRRRKEGFAEQLYSLKVDCKILPRLKADLEKRYREALCIPGECVGISGAQAMGEFGTQATLNTFHVAGFESSTSVTSGVVRFQEIINASKTQKSGSCLVYFEKYQDDIQKLRSVIGSAVVGNRFSKIVEKAEFESFFVVQKWHRVCNFLFAKTEISKDFSSAIIFHISLQKLFRFRIHPSIIKFSLEKNVENIICCFMPLSSSQNDLLRFDVLVKQNEQENLKRIMNLRDKILPEIEDTLVCGNESITGMHFHFDRVSKTWFLETEWGSLRDVVRLQNVDCKRTTCNSVWDILELLGIEAAAYFLNQELSKIITGVDKCHIKLLVDRMTFSGTICSITRYTMRNEEGPLGKASFEESMETFIKAAKFGEIDKFTGVSAAVIGGKKPRVGTSFFDLRMNMKEINERSKGN